MENPEGESFWRPVGQDDEAAQEGRQSRKHGLAIDGLRPGLRFPVRN
jgi:hypothetical protein